MVNLPRLLADPYVERRVKQQVHMQRILVQKKKIYYQEYDIHTAQFPNNYIDNDTYIFQ